MGQLFVLGNAARRATIGDVRRHHAANCGWPNTRRRGRKSTTSFQGHEQTVPPSYHRCGTRLRIKKPTPEAQAEREPLTFGIWLPAIKLSSSSAAAAPQSSMNSHVHQRDLWRSRPVSWSGEPGRQQVRILSPAIRILRGKAVWQGGTSPSLSISCSFTPSASVGHLKSH